MKNTETLNHTYKTVESLLREDGKVNSAVIRNNFFKETNIYRDILLKTNCLDIFPNMKFCDRIMFLVNKMTLCSCKICGKPYIRFNNSQTTYRQCNHHFNVDSKMLKTALKSARSARVRNLLSSIDSKDYILSEDEFQSALDFAYNASLNYNFPIKESTFGFMHDLLVKSEMIIPIDPSNFRFSERTYLLKNNITEIPKCKYCNMNTTFRGRNHGYSVTCDKHKSILGGESHSNGLRSKLANLLNTNKYEIISLPHKLSTNPLVVKCRKCGKISSLIIKSGTLMQLHDKPLCKFCERNTSHMETELLTEIQNVYNGEILYRNKNRKIIPPYELDIFIPERKLAFEFDGLYWHSEGTGEKPHDYHLMKTEKCLELGIQLIHIFENEWIDKKEIVKSKIENILGVHKRTIYARKCSVVELKNEKANIFLEKNHIQGGCNSSYRIGLEFNGELVSVMTFSKPRFIKNGIEWELNRFCNKTFCHIPGAAGKLLAHFEREKKPKTLLSYADRRWSNGKVYKALGFILRGTSRPNYWYFRKPEFQLINRIKCQKHKLKKLLENFDPSLSEPKNMKLNGYDRIFDCGNLVFMKTYPENEKTGK